MKGTLKMQKQKGKKKTIKLADLKPRKDTKGGMVSRTQSTDLVRRRL
jgi:hypothetical protein